jgi:hypothetical protein
MAVNNLGELRALVKDWANRKDIPDVIYNSFINLAQDRANRVLRIPVLEKVSATLPIVNGTIILPSDYLEAKALTITVAGRTVDLQRKDLPYVLSKELDGGYARYFAREANKFILGPHGNAITAKLSYYYVASDLVNDADTNWFVEYGTDLLLYGALAELALYTKNTEEAQMFESKFRGAAAEIENMAMQAESSGSTLGIVPSR